ncbi:MAG: bifunctional glutamate N-acetyltransferase/amino-acid acetyltransferase ArgJ [Ignavibacteriales bacterium]|nr:MAG: bifunctional glutamate N-acetyltransferase/amino-acid acetyltransferase ArgJ [Ignavibacteriales bacterium]
MYQFINNGTVTSAKGFKAAGIFSGIKKKKKDLALIYSDSSCTAAGTFTLNKVKAAPLLVSQDVIQSKNEVKAVIVNSGNANACTGEAGYNDALKMQSYCAEKLGINANEVLISSTGVIGQLMPMDKLLGGIDEIVPQLSAEGGFDAAEAIMTTDKKMKSFAVKVELSAGAVTIGAICKGSGMIMPNMATMLAFVTTDAKIETDFLQKLLSKAVKNSFNKISVDGDTSTNDMVVILANGKSGFEVYENSEDENLFYEALEALSIEMAKSIVSDGEGATKLVTINVSGAHSEADADLVGKAVANSSLVKTAIYGEDANWGRIMSAAGNSGASIEPEKMSIFFNNSPVVLPNYNIVLDEAEAKEILSKNEFQIKINLNGGKYSSTWWTCDFSEEYVKINANYRT